MDSGSNDKSRRQRPESLIGLWIAIGAGMGTALGAAFGNIALGIPIGAGVGVAIGAALERQRKKRAQAKNRD